MHAIQYGMSDDKSTNMLDASMLVQRSTESAYTHATAIGYIVAR